MTDPTYATPGHALTTSAQLRTLLESARRIAVLGIKIERAQPAYYVPEYAQRAGYEIIPVPVYYPETTEILGQPVHRTLATVPGAIDIVNVFRRPNDIPAHLPDIIAKRPRAVWFQLGIRNDIAAGQLIEAGIDVVQDRCLMVDLRMIGR